MDYTVAASHTDKWMQMTISSLLGLSTLNILQKANKFTPQIIVLTALSFPCFKKEKMMVPQCHRKCFVHTWAMQPERQSKDFGYKSRCLKKTLNIYK